MISTIAFIFALIQAAGPSIALVPPEAETLAPGEVISFSVRVILPPADSGARVKLRPLALTNLRVARAESRVLALAGKEDRTVHRVFWITLVADEPGDASIGPIEVELDSGAEQPHVLTAEGFALRVIEPFDWNATLTWLPWVAGALALVGVGIFFALRYGGTGREAGDPAFERQREIIDNLDTRLRRGDFRGAADAAYGIIAEDDSNAALQKINNDDLRAARRLGEETRYAGYAPDRGEAAFIVKMAKEILTSAKDQSEGARES